MSQEKLSLSIVESLTEKELYTVAKFFLKEVEGITNVIVCNGPWDAGIDLTTINYDFQIQATVEEKNFEKKLFSDIAKAKENVDKYNLTKKIKYFYSHSLSNTLILRYRKKAKDDFNVYLDIIEANRIAEIASEYREIGKLLYDFSKLEDFQGESNYFDDIKVKAYYDLMSFGKVTDIKYNIIKSFVLNYLFNNSVVSKEDLLNETNQHFDSKMDESYFVSVLNRLSSEQKIKLKKEEVHLLDKERERISTVLQNYKIEEGLLIRDISEALKKYGIDDSVDQIVKQLSELYESTYSINLSEFTYRDSTISDVKTVTLKLKALINELSDGNLLENDVDALIKLLIKIADSSEILPRIAAGEVYSKVADPDRLERYVHQNIDNKTVFLDANVILNLLLAHYEPDVEYNSYFYTIANQFYKFCQKNELILKTIKSYSMEVASVFREALSIVPFTKLPTFSSLGGSSNIIYKFFQHLKDFNLLQDSVDDFEGFLQQFKFTSKTNLDDNFKSQMEFLLRSMNIEIEEINKYEYGQTAEIIRQEVKANNKVKSNFAVVSDAIMFERLGDSNSEINPVDPIFCTWDIVLMKTRKAYFEKFPGCTRWYMFTPTRLMDHISMMNFQIKPGMVSNEILTILDQGFSFQQMTHTLLDSVASVINADSAVGLKYTNMLSEIREKQILEVDAKIEVGADAHVEVPPIDVIFRELFENYILNKENKSEEFKKLFTIEDYFEEITRILQKEKDNVIDEGKASSELIPSIDKLIEKEASKNKD